MNCTIYFDLFTTEGNDNMSINKLKHVFENATQYKSWSIQLLRIATSKRNGTIYTGREIRLYPEDKISEFVSELSNIYTNSVKGILLSYTDVLEYDGTAMGNIVYRLSTDNELIRDEYDALIKAIAAPDNEINPLEFSAQAYILKGMIKIGDSKYSVKFISMQNPLVKLKHRFINDGGTFKEISDKVLSLRQNIDVVILEDSVYMLTLAGEKLFNMERSYRAICENKIDQIIACDILSDADAFSRVAGTGHNPRRFISFKESRLEKLKDRNERRKMAEKFNIPIADDKFDTTQEGTAEKIVKLLCNKGMLDPFEDTPVEVAASKKWT